MGKFAALLKLTRIEHSLMLAIAVVAAELITGRLPLLPVFILALIPPILVSMGSFAINDYFDVDVDRKNKKNGRPLVNGSLTKNDAIIVTALCFFIGIAASAFINAYSFIIVLVFAVLAYLYSYKLKETLLVGNVYIAFTMVIPFLYGNYVVSNAINANIILISIVIFLSGLAREIHGMIRDFKGDFKARRIKNLVYYIGGRMSAYLAFLLYMEAIGVSLFMFFFMMPFAFNLAYLIPILVVDISLLYVSVMHLASKPNISKFKLYRNLSLGAMALALITYLIVPLVYLGV